MSKTTKSNSRLISIEKIDGFPDSKSLPSELSQFRLLRETKVVLVGGPKMMQFTINRWLEDDGAEVSVFDYKNADAGAILSRTPDIVIFDSSNTMTPFIEFLKQLLETKQKFSDAFRVEIPIILLTSGEIPEALRRSVDFGQIYYLEKPLNKVKLTWAIRNIVEGISPLLDTSGTINKNICVADRDEIFQSFISDCLKQNGFMISKAVEVDQITENIKQMRSKILIIDLLLLSDDKCKSIRHFMDISPQLKVVGTLPLIDNRLIENAYDSGMRDHFVKPVPLLNFVKKIKNLI